MKFLKDKILFLAPMAGYTNTVCRKLFREYGADASVTEFVYSRAVLHGADRIIEKMSIDASARPVGVQIFGSDPDEMSAAAQLIAEKVNPEFIDVNFGCPAPNAVGAGAGSALLKEPQKMSSIIKKMVESVKIPVTAKLRTGWSFSSIIVPDVCKRLQDAGAKMITLHGRTKTQGYEGDADWSLIEKTAQSLEIALIGNGSVEKLSVADLRSSACKGFMIGRAALGNPWIFGEIRAKINGEYFEQPSVSERVALALRYARIIADSNLTGISNADLTHAKSQIMRFLKNGEGFKKLRGEMRNIKTLSELEALLCEYV